MTTSSAAAVPLTRSASLVRVAVAYVVALAVAGAWLALGPTSDRPWLDALVADVLATLVVFCFSRAHRNSSFYDAYWSVAPPLLLVFWWATGSAGAGAARCWLVALVVACWSVRLTAHWVSTFPGLHHEDWRYPLLRQRAGRAELLADLAGIHLVPTLQVFLAMVPAYLAVSRPGRPLGRLDVLAFGLGLGAVGLELLADRQLHAFTRSSEPGEAMDRGLWSWSRHPNYVGELCFWVAVALFGLAAAPAQALWVVIGPAAMLGMFLGASIPMMEERSLARRPAYAEVQRRVSRFVPRPPRRS